MSWARCLLGVVCAATLAATARSSTFAGPLLEPVPGSGGCVVTAPAERARGCLPIRAFHARVTALTPDGRWLYTAGGFDASSSMSAFGVNLRTGRLSPAGAL